MSRTLYIIGVVIAIFFTGVASIHSQTDDKAKLRQANQNLALSIQDRRFDDAREYAIESLRFEELVLGENSKESFSTRLALANVYAKLGKMKEAGEQYLKSIALAAKHFGIESNEIDSARANFSYFFVDYPGSISFWEEFRKQNAELFGYEVGKSRKLSRPKWPAEAKDPYKEGSVIVKIWVDELGNVTSAKAMFGEMVFASSAEEAAKRSKFYPGMKEGKPVGFITFATFTFSIPRL